MDKITKNINDVLLNSESDNGYKAQLYKRTNHGHVEFVYAFAGTDDWSDVVDDIDQYYGGSPNQYKMAVANAEILSSILKEKYGNNVDFTFVGHSLGGGEAAAASMTTGFDAITFNPAAVTSDDLLGNPSHITNNIALGTKLFTIWGKDVYYGGDMLHNFQSNTNVDIPGAINYIQLGLVPLIQLMISTTIFIRIMTNKLFVFSFLVLLTSCGLPYVHKVQLTKDDLSWIDHYHDTDTLVFTSNKGVDTLTLISMRVSNPRNTFVFDPEGVRWYNGSHEFHGNAYVEMKLRHSGTSFVVGFYIRRNKNTDPLRYSIIFGEKSTSYENVQFSQYQIHGCKLDSCLVINSNNMNNNLGDQPHLEVKSIVWNKSLGLVQYELNHNIIYTIKM